MVAPARGGLNKEGGEGVGNCAPMPSLYRGIRKGWTALRLPRAAKSSRVVYISAASTVLDADSS
eukprot:1239982-Amphidinium_carterae.1